MYATATKPIINKPQIKKIAEYKKNSGYNYVVSGEAFEPSENAAIIPNSSSLKEYLKALKKIKGF